MFSIKCMQRKEKDNVFHNVVVQNMIPAFVQHFEHHTWYVVRKQLCCAAKMFLLLQIFGTVCGEILEKVSCKKS